jgi:hypothetical protein
MSDMLTLESSFCKQALSFVQFPHTPNSFPRQRQSIHDSRVAREFGLCYLLVKQSIYTCRFSSIEQSRQKCNHQTLALRKTHDFQGTNFPVYWFVNCTWLCLDAEPLPIRVPQPLRNEAMGATTIFSVDYSKINFIICKAIFGYNPFCGCTLNSKVTSLLTMIYNLTEMKPKAIEDSPFLSTFRRIKLHQRQLYHLPPRTHQ